METIKKSPPLNSGGNGNGNSSGVGDIRDLVLKKFTFKQVQEKVAERWQIPEYYDILMEAAVKEDDEGIYFNLKHPSFQKLTALVKDYDRRTQEEKKKRLRQRALTTRALEHSPSISSTSYPTEGSQHVSPLLSPNNEASSQTTHHTHTNTEGIHQNTSSENTNIYSNDLSLGGMKFERSTSDTPENSFYENSNNHSHSNLNNMTDNDNESTLQPIRKKPPGKTHRSKSHIEWVDVLQQQLSSSHPSPKLVRDACRHVGIPERMRGQIWKILLDVPNKKAQMKLKMKRNYINKKEENENKELSPREKEQSHDNIGKEKLDHKSPRNKKETGMIEMDPNDENLKAHSDSALMGDNHMHPFASLRENLPPLPNQRVIQADIERTRPNLKWFQDLNVRREMEIILTEYCYREQVSYKQGMNYILAPFFMVEMTDRLDIYLSFQSFVDRYLSSTFNDEEFGSLQCIFRLFRLLSQYHDPTLSVFLDQYDIVPELFASGWFMTIHANKSDHSTLLYLWDEILLEPDPCFHYFIDLELLKFFKEDIMKRTSEELPQFLVNIMIEDKDHARRLIREARKTSYNTPQSFHELLHKCTKNQIRVDGDLFSRLERLPCIPIECKELIGHCYADILLAQNADNGSPRGFSVAGSSMSQLDSNRRFDTKRKKSKRSSKNISTSVPFVSIANSNLVNTSEDHIHDPNDKDQGATENDSSGTNDLTAINPSNSTMDSNIKNTNIVDEEENHNEQKKMSARKIRKQLKQAAKYAAQKHLKFFIVDCRPKEQFDAGHLPCAFHLDPTLDVSSEELREKLTSLLSMSGCHFVLFFNGRHEGVSLPNPGESMATQNMESEQRMNPDYGKTKNNSLVRTNSDRQYVLRQAYLLFFLEKRVKYISICEEGYAGTHNLIVRDLELIDHDPDKCIECNGKWKQWSMFSSVKQRMMEAAQGMKRRIQTTRATIPSMVNTASPTSNKQGLFSTLMSSPTPRGYYSYETLDLNNYLDDKEFPSNCPQIHLCKNDPMLMIYLFILRDRETKDHEKYRTATQKLLTLMFQQMLQYHYCEMGRAGMENITAVGSDHMGGMEPVPSPKAAYFPLTFSQSSRYSTFDSPFACIAGERGIYGVALGDSSEHALQNVLQSFSPIIKSVVGTLKVEETYTQEKDGTIRSNRQAIALMPKDIKTRIVLVFHPILAQNELHSAIDALTKLGSNEKDIIVFTFVASRAALIALTERFPHIHIWCVSVDTIKHGKIFPGIGSFKHRYKYIKAKNAKKKLETTDKNKEKEKSHSNENEHEDEHGHEHGHEHEHEHDEKEKAHYQNFETDLRTEDLTELQE